MKKISERLLPIIMLCACIISLFVGCSGKPSGMSEAYYNYGKRALEIVDGYLDLKKTASEAYDELKELDRIEETLQEPTGVDSSVSVYVLCLNVDLLSVSSGYGTADYDDVLEGRNNLAKTIGEKLR